MSDNTELDTLFQGSTAALKRYWGRGEGAAKIRWGTEGDLTRCHRQLNKYLTSDDAWGFCNNLHKDLFGRPNQPD